MKKMLLASILGISCMQITQAENLRGNHWSAVKSDDAYVVSIADKASVLDALTDFVTNQKITAAQITGIGATNEVTLRFFNPVTKHYVDKAFTEQMEISNLSGNVALFESKPLLHLHVTLGRQDYTALAGHLLDAKIRGAGEIYVYPFSAKVTKTHNESIGLNLYDFE